MKIYIILFISFLVTACSVVPITGRHQFSAVPASTMRTSSFKNYNEVLKSSKLSNDKQKTQLVKTVGKKIQKAVEKFFDDKGLANELDGYEWEFNLIESPEMNAWCMPGGKVAVYTGILPVAKNEIGLATIMGHEIAHAVAQHGNERMSQQLLVQLGGMGIAAALQNKPEQTQKIFMSVFGAGSQLGFMLPFSRLHENEADRLGLIFMAMAGYNPAEAVKLWERMKELGGDKLPEFMSTHPSDDTRIKNLKELQSEAMDYYLIP